MGMLMKCRMKCGMMVHMKEMMSRLVLITKRKVEINGEVIVT